MKYSYLDMFDSVMHNGQVIEVRGLKTKERLAAGLELPADVLPQRPGLNPALGYMELLQLVAGVFDGGALRRVATKANHKLFTQRLAYGPRSFTWERGQRMNDQLAEAHGELIRDPFSRRAVLQLAEPQDTYGPEERPCTTSIQFLLRGYLHTIVTMRSWDLWLGLPYDMVMFGGLTQLMAHCLGVVPGTVRVTAGSAHVYEPHWTLRPSEDVLLFSMEETLPKNWPGLRAWAKDVVANEAWVRGTPPGIYQETMTQWTERLTYA